MMTMKPARPPMGDKLKTTEINGLIRELAAYYGWNDRLDEEKAKSIFKSLLDPATAACITDLFIQNRILYVRLNSAAAKNNLLYRTDTLVGTINEQLEQDMLREIRLG